MGVWWFSKENYFFIEIGEVRDFSYAKGIWRKRCIFFITVIHNRRVLEIIWMKQNAVGCEDSPSQSHEPKKFLFHKSQLLVRNVGKTFVWMKRQQTTAATAAAPPRVSDEQGFQKKNINWSSCRIGKFDLQASSRLFFPFAVVMNRQWNFLVRLTTREIESMETEQNEITGEFREDRDLDEWIFKNVDLTTVTRFLSKFHPRKRGFSKIEKLKSIPIRVRSEKEDHPP